jgi:hypothetical protein
MSRTLLAVSFLAVFSIPVVAAAQPGQPPPPPPPGSSPSYGYGAYGMTVPGWHEHEGFMLRIGIGGGYLNMSAEEGGTEVSVNGPAGVFNIALGGNLSPGLIIYGELFGNAIVDPTVEVNGDEFETEDASASIAGIGVGLAYYLPSNLYFSGTLSASQLRFTQEGPGVDDEYETDFGPAFTAQIGKEWWVSDNWGLGLAGQFLFGSLKDEDEDFGGDVTWTTTGLSLLFSATYD